MFWFVCRKIGMLPALLHLKRVFCQLAKAYANFYLILLKKTFLFVFRQSYAVFSIMFLRTDFSLFRTALS